MKPDEAKDSSSRLNLVKTCPPILAEVFNSEHYREELDRVVAVSGDDTQAGTIPEWLAPYPSARLLVSARTSSQCIGAFVDIALYSQTACGPVNKVLPPDKPASPYQGRLLPGDEYLKASGDAIAHDRSKLAARGAAK